MTTQENSTPKAIGISISNSPDMRILGLGDGHLRDALNEVLTHVLASGYDLAYAGDLRVKGFTWTLFDLSSRYTRQPTLFIPHLRETREQADGLRRLVNYFAWPVHIRMTNDELDSLAEKVYDVANLVFLDMEGTSMAIERRKEFQTIEPDDATWAKGLTAMRKTVRDQIDARIILGGRIEGHRGPVPGVAEEALLSLQTGQPVFLLGGFGGCARDIAETLGLVDTWPGSRDFWPGRADFEGYGPDSLKNGLSAEENQVMAESSYIDQWLPLLLRGLLRL